MKIPTLIGHAGELLDLLSVTLADTPRIKVMFAGQPGVGKSEVSRRLAHSICGGKFGVEELIGRKASVHHVYEWQECFATSGLFGTGKKIVVVNEIDTMPKDALDAMLALLDDMPAGRGVIGTTNQKFADLPERFRSRFQRYDVRAPEDVAIAGMLEFKEGLPPSIARQIAALSGGNVRGALMDAAVWKNENVRKPRGPVVLQTSLAELGL